MSSSVVGTVAHVNTLIIGGGPCGLGSAFRLEELASLGVAACDSWLLVDAASSAGGLARSVVDANGFTWDMGGHVIFSHYAYFSRLLDVLLPKEEWRTLEREAWVWMKNTFVPYPLQQNIHRLPKDDITKILNGLIDVDSRRSSFVRPSNFGDWLSQSFGSGLCDVFMRPYNFKVWAFQPEKMNVEWMGERVATVDIKKILKNLVSGEDELGWGPNSTFRFPLHGGTGVIWQRLFERLPQHKFRFNKRVVNVDAKAKCVHFQDGSTIHYQHLISSMPMDQLIACTSGLANYTREVLIEKSKQFVHSASHIIGIGLEGQAPDSLKTKCWLYFPEDDCPFYRATVFSNYSPYHCPKPHEQWSIMCEVSESSDKPVDVARIIQLVEQGCRNTALIKSDDVIVSRWHERLEYGYPTPFAGRDQLCTPLFDALEAQNIYSRGRFGAWKYEVSNQDHSLMQGVEAVDRAHLSIDEMTVKHCSVVNAKRDNTGRTPIIYQQLQQQQAQVHAAQTNNSS